MEQVAEVTQEEAPELQRAMLLKHLREEGPITELEARILYGIGRTAARIHELRKQYTIPKQMVPRKKANGRTARVAMYWLEGV